MCSGVAFIPLLREQSLLETVRRHQLELGKVKKTTARAIGRRMCRVRGAGEEEEPSPGVWRLWGEYWILEPWGEHMPSPLLGQGCPYSSGLALLAWNTVLCVGQ